MSLGSVLQENLLVLLAFDKERCKIIRGTVEVELFGGVYREIASRIYDYIDKYKAPPKEHLADILDDKLTSDNKREVNTFKDILENIYDVHEGINAEYVISQLETFVKRQSLRTVAVDLAKALQRDTEESLEEADTLIKSAQSVSLKVFDPGIRLSNIDKALGFLDIQEISFPTGIPEFDKRGFGPTRKELFLYIADTKTGKTWCMTQLIKAAVMSGAKCLHVTLEMSEDKVTQRYMQALFAISKRKETFIHRKFEHDANTLSMEEVEVKPKLTFEDANIRKKLRRKLERWKNRILDNIIVKEFPTSKLTLQQLEAYLDNLEVTERFVPDILIVDYPDLMKLNTSGGDQYRHKLTEVYKGLRGIGVARNMAVACPTQANRQAAGAATVGRTNVSEAYGKLADADVAVTYSQTQLEKNLGLARLTVVAGRNDEDNLTVVLSQNYGMGQYVIDSILMPKGYMEDYGNPKKSSFDSDDDDTPDDDDE